MLPIPLSLSAPNAPALRGQAARLRAQLADRPEVDLLDVGLLLGDREHRVRAPSSGGCRRPGAFLRGLDALSQGQAASGVVRGVAGTEDRVVFVFPGQGAHWAGMAVELMASSEVFRESIRSCARAFAPFVDWSLEEVLSGEAEAPGLDRVDVVQPVLFGSRLPRHRDRPNGHGRGPGAVRGDRPAGRDALDDLPARRRIRQDHHSSGGVTAQVERHSSQFRSGGTGRRLRIGERRRTIQDSGL
jgi:acyl transferase family protein